METAIPEWLLIHPESRWPTRLPEETLRAALESAVPSLPRTVQAPMASIVVPTCGQLAFTKLCLASILESRPRLDYEVIVVDNNSPDATRDYLQRLRSLNPHVRLILNARNRGFAGANNQGLAIASGKILILLNNDTLVAPGWLDALAGHLEDQRVGMVGPLTNRSGGENETDAPYRTFGEFLEFAAQAAQGRLGESFQPTMLPMVCVAMRRDVWSSVGPLDENFQIGLFEDDDYCLRVRQAGRQLLCAADCFVHHFGQASMGGSDSYGTLFERNRKLFEKKWGTSWQPRTRRLSPDYRRMIERLKQGMEERLSGSGEVAVISRGDEEVLNLGRFQGRHFMEGEARRYAGYHAADSAEALSRLRAFENQGALYLVVPQTSAWWLDHYVEFRRHLERGCGLALDLPGTGRVYRLAARERRGSSHA